MNPDFSGALIVARREPTACFSWKGRLAAVVAVLSAATASAQSSITIFGDLDASVSHYTAKSVNYNDNPLLPAGNALGVNGVNLSQTVLANSAFHGSRMGFKGTEDLGNGYGASFWLESGLLNNNGGGQLIFDRRATVSLQGPFGELRLGRDYTPTFMNDTIFDPFLTQGVGVNLIANVGGFLAAYRATLSGGFLNNGLSSGSDNYVRTANSVGYLLPAGLGGFYGQAMYAFAGNVDQSNVPGDPSLRGQYAGGRFGYTRGDFDMALAYGRSIVLDTFSANEALTTLNLGASYDFGPVKLFGELSQLRDASLKINAVNLGGLPVGVPGHQTDRYNGGLIGASVPIGASAIRFAYERVDFDNGAAPTLNTFFNGGDASSGKWTLGYNFFLSKRTTVYLTYAHARVTHGQNSPVLSAASIAGGTPFFSTNPQAISGIAAGSSSGYDIGISHAF